MELSTELCIPLDIGLELALYWDNKSDAIIPIFIHQSTLVVEYQSGTLYSLGTHRCTQIFLGFPVYR